MKASSSFSVRSSDQGKAVRQLGGLFFVLLILVYLSIILLSQFFGWRFDAVTTGSMEPTFKVGGVVVVQPADPMNIKMGDIITYEALKVPEVLVTHRIVGVTQANGSITFQTKGDANNFTDMNAIPPENIKGKVWLYVPLFGYFVAFVKTPLGFLLCLAIPAVCIIWGEFRRML